VDVEATALLQQEPQLIGGFRKMDWPPVPLHIQRDPPYAESEITIDPYPPRAGEPTRICVELTNQSDRPRTVDVAFEVSNELGIGLPLSRSTTSPSRSRRTARSESARRGYRQRRAVLRADCAPRPRGRLCRSAQPAQHGRERDPLCRTAAAAEFVFPVRNPNPFQVTIHLTATNMSSFFDILLQRLDLPDMQPGETRPMTLTVMPRPGLAPEDGTIIADVEASFVNAQQERILIGGIRKIYRPPIPIHRPGDPPYAEREISIEPYPPRAGEPTEICVELRNPTDSPQTIWVEFAWATLALACHGMPSMANW